MDKNIKISNIFIVLTFVLIMLIASILLVHLGKLIGKGLYYILNTKLALISSIEQM